MAELANNAHADRETLYQPPQTATTAKQLPHTTRRSSITIIGWLRRWARSPCTEMHARSINANQSQLKQHLQDRQRAAYCTDNRQ